jgi:hypothetical protein
VSRARGTAGDPAARAARLLGWYPKTWRDRYGDEFAELLISDIEERPRSAARTLDVAGGGIVAHFTAAGLCGVPVRDASRHVTASLVSLGCCLAVFGCIGAAMWSQLTIGWQWSGARRRLRHHRDVRGDARPARPRGPRRGARARRRHDALRPQAG